VPDTSRDTSQHQRSEFSHSVSGEEDGDEDNTERAREIGNTSSEAVVPVSHAASYCCSAHRAWLPSRLPCQDTLDPISLLLDEDSRDPFVDFDSVPHHPKGQGSDSQEAKPKQSDTRDFLDEPAFDSQFREVEACHASLAAAKGAFQDHFRHIGAARNEEQCQSHGSQTSENPPRVAHDIRQDSPMAPSKQSRELVLPLTKPARRDVRTLLTPTPGEWFQGRLPLPTSPYGAIPSNPTICAPASVHVSSAKSSPPPATPSPPHNDIGIKQAPITEGDDIQMFGPFPAIHPRHPGRLSKERFPPTPSTSPMPPEPSARDLASIGHIQVIAASPPPEEDQRVKKPLRSRLLPWLLIALTWLVAVTICCAVLGHNHHQTPIPSLLGHTDQSSDTPLNSSFFHSMDFEYNIHWPPGFPTSSSAYKGLAHNATLSPARAEIRKTVFANETGQTYTKVNEGPKPWSYELPPGSMSNMTLYPNSSSNSTGLYVALRCTANYTQDLIALQRMYPSLFEAAKSPSSGSTASTDTSNHLSNGINILYNVMTILCFLPFWLLLSCLPQLVKKPEKKQQHCCKYKRVGKRLGWVGTWVAVVVASILVGALLSWGLREFVGWVAERV
jgi:hypothetical protein